MAKDAKYHNTLLYWIKQRGYQCYEVAEAVHIPRRTLSDYCHGRTAIPRHRLETLAQFLECPIATLLGETGSHQEPERSRADSLPETPSSSERKEAKSSLPAETQGIIQQAAGDLEGENLDQLRRDLVKLATQVPFFSSFTGRDLLNFSVEEYIAYCDTLIQGCWKLMGGKYLAVAEHILSAQINPLMQIVYSTSRFRREAAATATKAKIVQAILAMHRLDFAARELCCMEAITCAFISNRPHLLAVARMYLAYTYVYHSIPHQPGRAVILFQEALQGLEGEEPLLCAALHSGFAAALAQCGHEKEALDSLAKAQAWFPPSPERDPSFGLIDCGKAEFSLRTGKIFLDLAQHYPQHGYYEQANQAFEQSIILQAMAERSTSEILIHQGAAALGLGDLELYEASLRKGLVLAKEVGSQKRLIEAHTIFQHTPHIWQTDKRISDLKEEFFLPAHLPKGIL